MKYSKARELMAEAQLGSIIGTTDYENAPSNLNPSLGNVAPKGKKPGLGNLLNKDPLRDLRPFMDGYPVPGVNWHRKPNGTVVPRFGNTDPGDKRRVRDVWAPLGEMKRMKTKPSAEDAETIRINPKVSARQGIPNKTYQTFVSEMFFALIEGAKWIPLNFAADPEAAHREIARRRKREAEDRENDDARNAGAFHSLPNSMKARMIKAGSPGMSDKEAAAKASLVVGTKKRRGISEEDEKRESTKSMIARLVAKRSRKLGQPVPKDVERDMEPNIHAADPRPTNEAILNEGDPNRGDGYTKKYGGTRANKLVSPGMASYGVINPKTGKPVRTLGKLHKRLAKLSPEDLKRYRNQYGIRTGFGRLYPLP